MAKERVILKKKSFPDPPNKKDFSEVITPASIFSLFFDDEVIRLIVEMTNLYARRDHGDHTFTTTPNERRRFIAILLLSGYNWLPHRGMYWETAPDVHNQCVADAIPRNRFDTLMKYLHLCDNEKPVSGDKMWKIRPFYDVINKECAKYDPFNFDLSVDESILPYYGRNSSKQRIANKPVRVGYMPLRLQKMVVLVLRMRKIGDWVKALSFPFSVFCRNKFHLVFILITFFTSFRLVKHLQEL